MRTRLRSIPVFANVRPTEFRETGLPDNPLPVIAEWILAADAAGQPEPHAMSLCTVGASGVPSSRVLIVKDIDDDRLYFATPADSRKGREIAANANVSAHFYWPAVGRQVRIVGTAAGLDRAASESDFADRGRASRLAAHLHRQGPLADRPSALAEFDRLGTAHPDDVPCPPSWTLYAISPTEVEFWEASADRVHHRVAYRRDTGAGSGAWRHELMWP
ncbi:pyridoxine/pyridoxamine 5'-phosphate oxidase [Streptomyces rugosispiralis]|uniref:Pyridoxal 5'-phosphate synthase n=1 Tax=Streptomyces rugosispiralis TaxID=2967341 RepID=A0ABT1V6L8_9ACTN|nr:pyridoxal 5'-phosphate synthase [Streptomyces rugosispiralis]MCQ8193032.1 pyridoxal 5'-phosphate synthase [Streptomyces rugosispiralis]